MIPEMLETVFSDEMNGADLDQGNRVQVKFMGAKELPWLATGDISLLAFP